MQAKHGSAVSFRSHGRLIGCLMALALTLSALVFASTAAAGGPPPTPTKAYLALGDSITFGYTHEKFNANYPNENPAFFEQGFDNFFYKDLKKPTEIGNGIELVNDGCPGETSDGLVGHNGSFGGGPGAEYNPCAYTFTNHLPLHNGGYYNPTSHEPVSQLEEAYSLLTANDPYTAKPDEVDAITLNIGSNDELAGVATCKASVAAEYGSKGYSEGYPGSGKHFGPAAGQPEPAGSPEAALQNCLGFNSLTKTFPHIVANLENVINVIESAGYTTKPIVLLGFYNPDGLLLRGSDGLQVKLNEDVEKMITKLASSGYTNLHFANPFPKFNNKGSETVAEWGKPIPPPGAEPIPANEKGTICKYTEMCNQSVQEGSTGVPETEYKNGDIHPTLAGYTLLGALVNDAYLAPACTASTPYPFNTAPGLPTC